MCNCEICGQQIEKSMFSNAVLCSAKCHTAHYWLERVKNKDSKTQVVIGDTMYQIEPEDDIGAFRGYDGALFYVKFYDGRLVRTTNLWFNGKIPEAFRSLLPPNAELMSRKKIVEKQLEEDCEQIRK